MEIRLVIDDRVVDVVRRVFRRRHVVPATVIGCLLAGGAVYALSATPPNTFQDGQVLSAAALNQNFSAVYQAVSALEQDVAALEQSLATANQGLSTAQSDIGALESDVQGLQSDVADQADPFSECQIRYAVCDIQGTGSGRFCNALCPSGTRPVSGACSFGDPVANSWENPEYSGTQPASGAAITSFTGWSCGGQDLGETVTYVVCCPS